MRRLRATVWFLPVLLIATRLTTADLAVFARGMAVLNLVALAGGIYVYQNGVEALYPNNAITQIIYGSNDVAGYKYHRIPSTFLSAHAYGGTMLLTLPFLLGRLVGLKVRLADRCLAVAGVVAAAGGMVMCGARSPLILLALTLAIAWLLSRLSVTLGLVGVVLVAGGLWFASTSERFQRAASLQDTGMVGNRIAMSANASFLDLLVTLPAWCRDGVGGRDQHPVLPGRRGTGTDRDENEYGRILVDQGWVGLGGWLAFLVWLFVRPPPSRPADPWRIGVVLMYSLTLASCVSAFIGTGMLSSVPGTVILLAQMGVLVGVRARERPPRRSAFSPGPPQRERAFPLPFPFAAKSRGRGALERPRARSVASAQDTTHPNPPPQGGREMEYPLLQKLRSITLEIPLTSSPGPPPEYSDDRMAVGDRRLHPARRHGPGEPGPGPIPGRPRRGPPRHTPGLG